MDSGHPRYVPVCSGTIADQDKGGGPWCSKCTESESKTDQAAAVHEKVDLTSREYRQSELRNRHLVVFIWVLYRRRNGGKTGGPRSGGWTDHGPAGINDSRLQNTSGAGTAVVYR